MHAVLPAGTEKPEVMTSRLTIAEATAALDAAIARHKEAESAAANLYCGIVAARQALNAAVADDDYSMQLCVVSVRGKRTYKMVVIDRRDDQITCRYLGGSNNAQVKFKWHAEDGSYIAMIGDAFDRDRRIVAIDGERLREPTKQDREDSE